MSRLNINAVRSEALFASELQCSEAPTAGQVRDAVRRVVRELGSRGCAARVAQEFGDHPDTAVARMRWACRIVEEAFGIGPRGYGRGRPQGGRAVWSSALRVLDPSTGAVSPAGRAMTMRY